MERILSFATLVDMYTIENIIGENCFLDGTIL